MSQAIGLLVLKQDTQLIEERYDLTLGAAYLIRPDQYIAVRWKQAKSSDIKLALYRAMEVA
jgi:3-(3-hydroxy-phenyl)propionate hydroxylase